VLVVGQRVINVGNSTFDCIRVLKPSTDSVLNFPAAIATHHLLQCRPSDFPCRFNTSLIISDAQFADGVLCECALHTKHAAQVLPELLPSAMNLTNVLLGLERHGVCIVHIHAATNETSCAVEP
jgi:hypothetical protein